jgi:hypothetical protein
MPFIIFLQLASIYGWVPSCLESTSYDQIKYPWIMFNLKINYYIIHGSNVNPWSKGARGKAQGCIFIYTQIHHFTFRVGFIWYVCFYSPFHLQPFFGVTIHYSVGSPKTYGGDALSNLSMSCPPSTSINCINLCVLELGF